MTHLLRFSFLAFLLGFLAIQSAAKKPKILEGSLDPLKGVKKLNIQFVYDGMTIGKEEIPEADYIARKKEEMNEKEKGTGDRWATAWINDRSRKYELGFKTMFNKDTKIHVGIFPEEKYTLIFKSINLEPGYNVGISKKPSRLDGEAWIVETANPQTVICKLEVANAAGSMPFSDFDNGERIKYAYMTAAHILKEFIEDKID